MKHEDQFDQRIILQKMLEKNNTLKETARNVVHTYEFLEYHRSIGGKSAVEVLEKQLGNRVEKLRNLLGLSATDYSMGAEEKK